MRGGGISPNYTYIVENGQLNPLYTITGKYQFQEGNIKITGYADNQAVIVGVDFTNINYLTIHVYKGPGIYYIVDIDSTRVVEDRADNVGEKTFMLDVRSYTGIHTLGFGMGNVYDSYLLIYDIITS